MFTKSFMQGGRCYEERKKIIWNYGSDGGVLLVSVAAISWAETPDIVTIKNAIFVQGAGKWRVMGTTAPGNTVTVTLGGNAIGTSAPAKDNGRWRVFVSRSEVVARPGDAITATSSGGGTASQTVLIR